MPKRIGAKIEGEGGLSDKWRQRRSKKRVKSREERARVTHAVKPGRHVDISPVTGKPVVLNAPRWDLPAAPAPTATLVLPPGVTRGMPVEEEDPHPPHSSQW
jgi:hypothetical protein